MEHRFFYFLTCIWMIAVGSILITPVGIFCIFCGTTIDVSGFIGITTVFGIGIISISAGTIGLVALKKKNPGAVSQFFYI